jgi:hypothetical protein
MVAVAAETAPGPVERPNHSYSDIFPPSGNDGRDHQLMRRESPGGQFEPNPGEPKSV